MTVFCVWKWLDMNSIGAVEQVFAVGMVLILLRS